MATFLLKTEPGDYSIDDLERDGSTVWDGISNNAAQMHMRTIRKGDEALIYHTGKDKALVGLARVTSAPFPDPSAEDGRQVVFELEFAARAPTPVTLKEIKGDRRFEQFDLVRQPRLSVMPVPGTIARSLRRLSGL